MLRYWTVYKEFVRSSLVRELEFRANFIAKIIQNTTWVFFFYFIVEIIYFNTKSLAGWSRGEALALAATAMLVSIIHQIFFRSVEEFPELIRKGTLDFIVTKPLDAQFWVSTRRFSFNELGSCVAAIALLIYGIHNSQIQFNALQLTSFFVLLLCSVTIFYSLSFLLLTTSIYFVKVDNLWVLTHTTMEVARFPIDIYTIPFQRIFTFVFPLAFLASIPVIVLLKNGPMWMVPLGISFAALLFLSSRAFWQLSLRRYTSASS